MELQQRQVVLDLFKEKLKNTLFFYISNIYIMFQATDQNQQFVPNRTVNVMPDAQVDYGPDVNNQVKIHIPSFIGFLDPKSTKLNMKISMQGRGSAHPDGAAGMWSLCRDLRVTSGDGRAQLEDIQDLNVLTAQSWSYDENDSLNAKRELLEGSSKNGKLDAQLYWTKKADPFTAKVVTPTVPIQVQCSGVVPMSGIIGSQATNVFPLAATSGLRLQLNLETLDRGCTAASSDNVSYAPATVRGGAVGTSGTADIEATACLLFDSKVQADDDPAASTTASVLVARKVDRFYTIQAGTTAVAQHSTIDPGNVCAFEIGDLLYISQGSGIECMCLGVISELENVAAASSGSATLIPRLKITYAINRANGADIGSVNGAKDYVGINATTATEGGPVVFYDPRDRTELIKITHPAARDLAGNTYIIQDVSMSVLQVDPPEGYVSAMMDQVNGQGLNLDYCTSRLYRENLASPIGLQSINIPANAERAYSLLSVPLVQGRFDSTNSSSLLGTYEGSNLQNYQWVFNGNTVPDRPVDLRKYSAGKNAILHITELEKAIENAKIPVRNLWNIRERFMIARALSRYGQVHDLSGTSTQLRLDYGSTQGDSVMIETFCVALNRMVVTSMGIEVIH